MCCQKVVLATLALLGLSCCTWAASYGAAPLPDPVPVPLPGYQAVYPAPAYDGAVSAITDIAAAKASAAKINNVNWAALQQYGYEIGVPLLVKNYGPLTGLYSALAPKRSFVGTIDAGFQKDSYGNIKFRDESAIGAVAI